MCPIVMRDTLTVNHFIDTIKGEEVFPLITFGGKDISHFFDDQKEVKYHVNPETDKIDAFAPFGAFIDIPPQERIEDNFLKRRIQDEKMADKLMERITKQRLNKRNNNYSILKLSVMDMKLEDANVPWWQDEKYVIGLLTDKSRWIKIKNMLTKETILLEVCQYFLIILMQVMVCSEETIDEILLRYLKFNRHARSYTWKYMGQKLITRATLEQNGVPDYDFKTEKLRLNADDYISTINLYFNDDLTEM
ncbi:cytochrome b5 domain-containing protein 1 [Nephila pilipes]|uniref:Cytochrome b5 domain-containing protein 1 n=1 Tax=Nephila pilipes TaxID=299642 RepID=A0A8X6NR78_NEPPI|nr:cytochrome b5 domain-containing protein 1 [Nephila pilipes]